MTKLAFAPTLAAREPKRRRKEKVVPPGKLTGCLRYKKMFAAPLFIVPTFTALPVLTLPNAPPPAPTSRRRCCCPPTSSFLPLWAALVATATSAGWPPTAPAKRGRRMHASMRRRALQLPPPPPHPTSPPRSAAVQLPAQAAGHRQRPEEQQKPEGRDEIADLTRTRHARSRPCRQERVRH